jgi:hypothetical protein
VLTCGRNLASESLRPLDELTSLDCPTSSCDIHGESQTKRTSKFCEILDQSGEETPVPR